MARIRRVVLEWIYWFEWSWVQLSEGVPFEVNIGAKVVSFLAFSGNLLRHHFDIYFLGHNICILKLVANQIIGNSVGQLERARLVIVILGKQQIPPLILLLRYLAHLALIHIIPLLHSSHKLDVSLLRRWVVSALWLLYAFPIRRLKLCIIWLFAKIHEIAFNIASHTMPGTKSLLSTWWLLIVGWARCQLISS